MTKTHTKPRKRIALVGRLAIVAGAILAVTAGSVSTAQAQQGDENKITICHRTNSPSNPYRLITVSFDAGNGELQGPDHTGHPGPAFDFDASPEDVDYPYTSPRNGDQWGDIIPPYSWDGGSYPGSPNWTEGGEDIWDADCQGPDEPADPTCPVEGQVWDDEDDDGAIDEGECAIPLTCPADTTWVDANSDEVIDDGECQTDACPNDDGFQASGTTCRPDACPDVTGFQADTTLCPVEVINTVVEQTPAAPVTEVLGAQVAAAELPRTGKASLPLAELGLGLLLMGAAALIFARDEAATA